MVVLLFLFSGVVCGVWCFFCGSTYLVSVFSKQGELGWGGREGNGNE